MKKILVLSFLYEDPLCLKEFELLREHYNKIIDYFCFPIKYYGVRATEEGETRIDEENQIIWLHTDDLKEYDRKLIYKVVDCFKFIEKNNVDYDIIIKGNTSSYLNLIVLNNLLQHDNKESVYTGQVTFLRNYNIMNLFIRGNCICLYKKHIKDIIEADIENSINNISDLLKQREIESKDFYLCDDVIISEILIDKNNLYVKKCGHLAFDYAIEIIHAVNDIEDILKVGVVCCKFYKVSKDKKLLYTKDNLEKVCPDFALLKMVINYFEKKFIFDINPNTMDIEYWYSR